MAQIKELRLNSMDNSRKTLTRLFRAYNNGDLSTEKFRTMVYAMTVVLQYWKAAKDIEIESRIEALEDFRKTQGGEPWPRSV